MLLFIDITTAIKVKFNRRHFDFIIANLKNPNFIDKYPLCYIKNAHFNKHLHYEHLYAGFQMFITYAQIEVF